MTEENEITYLEASEKKDEDGWFTFFGYRMFESARQEYTGNNCIFAAGLIDESTADPPCDTLYTVMEKDEYGARVWLLRPDEMAAIARNASSALWSHYYREMVMGESDNEHDTSASNT